MGSQELFTGSEPPKEETKHSRHFGSKRRADELMENTDQLGRAADAPAIQEKETKGINGKRGAQKNTKELPALKLHCVVADSPLRPKLRPLPRRTQPLSSSDRSTRSRAPTQRAFRHGEGKPVRNSQTFAKGLHTPRNPLSW